MLGSGHPPQPRHVTACFTSPPQSFNKQFPPSIRPTTLHSSYYVSINKPKSFSNGSTHIHRPTKRQHRPRPSRRRRWPPLYDPNVSPSPNPLPTTALTLPPSYPLITLSTRAQVESKRAQSTTYDAIRRIIQREGITGLYSGLDSALFGISVTNFVYYYCTRYATIESLPHRPLMAIYRVRMDACIFRACRNTHLARLLQTHDSRIHDRWRHCRIRYSTDHESDLGSKYTYDGQAN